MTVALSTAVLGFSSRARARSMSALTKFVKIVEVGPRDGLQNEKSAILPTKTKLELISRLFKAGLRTIEAGAFVSPKRVPQMADASELLAGLGWRRTAGDALAQGLRIAVLTPNTKGLETMLAAPEQADEVAIFTAASESFNHANLGCSIEQSLEEFRKVAARAAAHGLPVRGYVSCVLGCPFEGAVPPAQVSRVTNKLLQMGCYEVSLGDTIGVGTPLSMSALLSHLIGADGGCVRPELLAVHCHDTYGRGLANITEALRQGVRVFDASVAGLGGCPFAPGATGNVATEDVVHMLHASGYKTGIDFAQLCATGEWITKSVLNRPYSSRAGVAFLATQKNAKL